MLLPAADDSQCGHCGRDGLANDPHLAGGVLQHVGNRAPHDELAAEALAIRQSDEQQVRIALSGLVDQRGTDLPGLQQDGFEARLEGLGNQLRVIQDLLGLLRPGGDVRVERHRPADLDDMDAHELAVGRSAEVRREADDAIVATAAGKREDRAPEGAWLGFGHLAWAASRWLEGQARRTWRAARHDTTGTIRSRPRGARRGTPGGPRRAWRPGPTRRRTRR